MAGRFKAVSIVTNFNSHVLELSGHELVGSSFNRAEFQLLELGSPAYSAYELAQSSLRIKLVISLKQAQYPQ